jgi:RND family efflux transporter MFP subunit
MAAAPPKQEDLRKMHKALDRSATPGDTVNMRRIFVGAALVALGAASYGLYTRYEASRRLAASTAEQATPTVAVIRPQALASAATLTLPATIEALNSAALNARANGYVRVWRADIGDHVKAGAVLAEIETPETDKGLDQARANLRAAKENEALAQKTNFRWSTLRRQGWVTQQSADEKESDLKAKSALSKAAQAEVERLSALVNFSRIEAPFDGVVTQRSVEVGQLVTAGGAGAPLFVVSDLRKMRIFVRVPQPYTGALQAGVKASLTLPEFPGRSFEARLARNAGAVDARSGSVLVEFEADNAAGALKPGAYAQANFALPSSSAQFRIPASAALYRGEGTRVAVVDETGRVALRQIAIGRDRGDQIEISQGVSAEDRVIDNPPDSIAEGDQVRLAPPSGEARAPESAGKKS